MVISSRAAPLRAKGFTIVELLVVIVVIAVLAAITVTAYNGVQERAESTKIISRAQAYVKGLKLWEADIGRPTTESCIAPTSYATCGNVMSWGGNKPNDAAFNATLNEYAGIRSPELGKYGADSPVGLMFYHPNWYGGNRGILGYRVGPNSDCGLGPLVASDHVTPAPSAKYTARTATYTSCEVEVFKY